MRFWLILIVVIFIFRFVLPVIMRWALKSFVRKQMQNGGFMVPPRPGPPPAPGQVRVEYVPPTAPAADKPAGFKGGDYVDFEEVK